MCHLLIQKLIAWKNISILNLLNTFLVSRSIFTEQQTYGVYVTKYYLPDMCAYVSVNIF